MKAKPITAEQAATEQHIHDLIEARDANVMLQYASFAEAEVDQETIRNLLLAILLTDERIWRFLLAEVSTHSRPMREALHDLAVAMDKQRATFMESAAQCLLREAQGEQA